MSRGEKSCGGCAYAVQLAGKWFCSYRRSTGRRRPIGPDGACMAKAEEGSARMPGRKRLKPPKRNGLDKELARTLYDMGLNDCQIAKEAKVSQTAVWSWRRKNGLPSKQRTGRPCLSDPEGGRNNGR